MLRSRAAGRIFCNAGAERRGKNNHAENSRRPDETHFRIARVCGFDVQLQPLEARRRIAYVPDFPFLYDKLTAWEFFRFTGQLFQMDDTESRRTCRNWSRVFIWMNL